MGRYCVGARAVVASCLLVALCAARSLPRAGPASSGGFTYHHLLWPRHPLLGGRPTLEQGGRGAAAHRPLFLGQAPWTILLQPRERLPPFPEVGSRKGAGKRKRVLSVLATLHPARPSPKDTGRRHTVPEGADVQPTHRPIGKQPLRWGR